MDNKVYIKNRKASFEYKLIEKFQAGIMLTGTEIKSIRNSKASIAEAFCHFRKDELWVKDMHIDEYQSGSHYNHEPKRERKLLLTKRELVKLEKKTKAKGYTIIPVALFISDRGLAKVEIALAQGKKAFDKRESIKEKDTKRDIDRALKGFR